MCKSNSIYFIIGIVLFVLTGCAETVPEEMETEAILADKIFSFSNDGAWCWFADPRAIHHEGNEKKTYVGWITSDGLINIASYDYKAKIRNIATIQSLYPDDHSNPALLITEDAHLMAFYTGHGSGTAISSKKEMYYRITKHSEDISSWESEQTIDLNENGGHGVTYPNPILLAAEDNKIYLFFRSDTWKPSFVTTNDKENWSPIQTLVDTDGDGQRPYVKYVSNGIDEIHFVFTNGHPSSVTMNNVYYAMYKNNAFYRADGTYIKSIEELPLTFDEVDKLYDAKSGDGRAWIWDIALDSNNSPVVVYATFPDGDNHYYYYAKFEQNKWRRHFITEAGGSIANSREPFYSGGISIDHQNPNELYLSREIEGHFEIEKWSISDDGISWMHTPITEGSNNNNIRPVVVRGYTHESIRLFWMNGDYTYFYKEYDTGIKAFPFDPFDSK